MTLLGWHLVLRQ
ncbi:Protein of unknown function [Propionibacterium freudenreichii]|nr:Protein of unknown function [Propionibacterium freudenreichii]